MTPTILTGPYPISGLDVELGEPPKQGMIFSLMLDDQEQAVALEPSGEHHATGLGRATYAWPGAAAILMPGLGSSAPWSLNGLTASPGTGMSGACGAGQARRRDARADVGERLRLEEYHVERGPGRQPGVDAGQRGLEAAFQDRIERLLGRRQQLRELGMSSGIRPCRRQHAGAAPPAAMAPGWTAWTANEAGSGGSRRRPMMAALR